MNTEVILISTVDTDGEHFFLIQPPIAGDMVKVIANVPKFSSGAEAKVWAKDRWQHYLQTQPALTETNAREALAEQGFDARAIEEKITKARRGREWASQHDIQFLTQPGYRNAHQQVVIRKTDAWGTQPFQRVFVIRCERCGHEYGANGCDTHACRCPACQNGSPGITV